jgi:hypothetical protein
MPRISRYSVRFLRRVLFGALQLNDWIGGSEVQRPQVFKLSVYVGGLLIAILLVAAKWITPWPILVILSMGLIVTFIFVSVCAFTLLSSYEHRLLRNTIVAHVLPMPLLALAGFLAASKRVWPYALLVALIVLVLRRKLIYPWIRKEVQTGTHEGRIG